MAETQQRVRNPADGPWCWQSKPARRKIREAFDASHNVATALSVYDALCEIASDAQAETFTTTHAWIQSRSGVSVRTIQNHLGVFAELGLIHVITPKLRAPSTYTLLSSGNGCASSGNGCTTNGNQCATFGNDQFHAPLPTLEESRKNRKESEEIVEAEGSGPAPDFGLEPDRSQPADPIWSKDHGWQGVTETHRQRLEFAYPACNIDRQLAQMDLWLRANPAEARKSSWLRFITNWLKRSQDNGGDSRSDRRASPTSTRPAGGHPFQMPKSDHSKGF